MSGRRSKALKAMNLNRAARRRSIRPSTPDAILMRLVREVELRERKRLNRAVARDKRRWSYRNRAEAIRQERVAKLVEMRDHLRAGRFVEVAKMATGL